MVGPSDGGGDHGDRPRIDRILTAFGAEARHRLARNPAVPDLARDTDHLAPDRLVLDPSLGHDRVRGDVRAECVAQLLSKQLRPEPSLAAGTRQQVRTEPRTEALDALARGVGGGAEVRQDGGHARTVGCGNGLGHGILGQGRDPGQLLDCHLRMQPGRWTSRETPELGPGRGQQSGHALEPGRHRVQPHLQRGELAGEQREEAATDQVDVAECVPRFLSQLGLVETQLRKFRPEQVAIDALVGSQRPVGESA